MLKRFSMRGRTTASFVTLALASASHTAYAQEAAADDSNENVIIVTAQKKSQNLQNVPIAITAFDASTLDSKVVDDGVDLSFSVPNLTVDAGGASLRGIGNLAISSTSESGLGYHVNGVYLGSPASEAEYYDLERIEVLRGPQGTLYGRNTTAGVINIITKKASNDFEGYLTAGYGNFNSVKVKGAINLPIADGLATRVAGFYLDRDGYTTNLFNGNDIDSREMFGLRSSTRLELGDSTTADLVVSYFREDDTRAIRSKGVCTKDPVTGCSALSAGFETPDSRGTLYNTLGAITGTIATGFGPAAVDYFANSVNPADLRIVNQDFDPAYFSEEWNGSLEISHEFGAITLTSLSAYQEINRTVSNDFDRFVPSLGLLRPITFDVRGDGNSVTTNLIQAGRRDVFDSRQYFQEIRLASDFDGPINFILGGNYYDQRLSSSAEFTHSTIAARQQQVGISDAFESVIIESNPVTTKSFGFFGEVYFDLSDNTKLTGGIRYSNDKKSIQTRQIFLNPQPDGSLPDFVSGRFKKGVVTGRVVLDHRFSQDLLGYISASRGYKAGGINPGNTDPSATTFDPEFLNAFEVGFKGSTSDGTFLANVSAFYYDYKGLQVGRVTQTSAATTNSDAEVYGAEAEFVIRPDSRFQVDGSISLLDTRIKNFQSVDEGDPFGIAPGTVVAAVTPVGVLKDLDGNKLPFSTSVKLSIGAQYAIPVGGMTLTPRIDHYEQGSFTASVFNKPSDAFPGYSQTDIKLLLAPEDGPWELRAYAKNLFNNDDITRITQDGPLVGRFRNVFVLEPRTYGVEATFRF